MPVNHRDFWYATYTLYSISEPVEGEDRLNDAGSSSSAGEQTSGAGGRQPTMVSFLKPVLKQIIMAGKSMQLLKNLDCKESVPGDSASRGEWRHDGWDFDFVLFSGVLHSKKGCSVLLRKCGSRQELTLEDDGKIRSIDLFRGHARVGGFHKLGAIRYKMLSIIFSSLYINHNQFHMTMMN